MGARVKYGEYGEFITIIKLISFDSFKTCAGLISLLL